MSYKKMGRRRKMMKNALASTHVIRHVAASKATIKGQQAHIKRKMGKFGAASPGRIIMKDGEIIDGQEAF